MFTVNPRRVNFCFVKLGTSKLSMANIPLPSFFTRPHQIRFSLECGMRRKMNRKLWQELFLLSNVHTDVQLYWSRFVTIVFGKVKGGD